MKTFVYKGPSMHPTFRDMDILCVLPYEARNIACGDVVVFSTPGTNKYTVHRIVRKDKGRIQTRGDNCTMPDPYTIQPESIIGYVGHVQRRDKTLHIRNGYPGKLTAFNVLVRRKIKFILKKMVSPVFNVAVNTPVFSRILFKFPKIRILSFNRPGGEVLYLSMGKHVIGKRLTGEDCWQIVRPKQLSVDEIDSIESV